MGKYKPYVVQAAINFFCIWAWESHLKDFLLTIKIWKLQSMGHAGITNPYFIVFIILINALSVMIIVRFRQKRKIDEERHKIPAESFKNLDLSFLKIQAKRWVDRHPEAKIEKIILYRQASLFQKQLNGYVPSRYFVVFETPENVNTAELESDTEYYETVPQGFKGLMCADFGEVYQNQPPPNGFKNEWTFFVKKLSKELPADVMVNEPFLVLYP